ncbi:MAG: hypothetical protein AB7F43_06590 [Bacteriovoracia bacterium]
MKKHTYDQLSKVFGLPFQVVTLIIITACTHFILVTQNTGIALANSEWAVFMLAADHIRKADFMVFPFQQHYGGLLLTWLRAIFSFLYLLFDKSSYAATTSHVVFSYLLCPILMTMFSFFMLRAFVSKTAAFTVGVICAIGFQYWIFQYGNDFYPAYYMVGCVLLIWRSKTDNPFKRFSHKHIFWTGALCGIAHYLSPAMTIYIVAILFPWRWIVSQVKSLVDPLPKWKTLSYKNNKCEILDGFILTLGFLFLSLFFYIEIFGRSFGSIAGRQLKIDSDPNLKIAVALFGIVWIRNNWALVKNRIIQRKVFALISGYIFGSLPERLFWLKQGHILSTNSWAKHDLQESFNVLGMIPGSMKTLISADLSLGQHFSIVLLLLSVFILSLTLVKKTRYSSKEGIYEVPAVIVIFTFFAYLRVKTYVADVAPARYLFPLFPVLIISIGLFVERSLKKRGWLMFTCVFLLAGHAYHHVHTRIRQVRSIQASHRIENMIKISDRFRRANVSVVISDDYYWNSLIYSILTQEKPAFWNTVREWGPPETIHLAKNERKVGLLLDERTNIISSKIQPIFEADGSREFKPGAAIIEVYGHRWRVQEIGHIGDKKLFIGTR